MPKPIKPSEQIEKIYDRRLLKTYVEIEKLQKDNPTKYKNLEPVKPMILANSIIEYLDSITPIINKGKK